MVMLELENGKGRPGLTIKSVMMPVEQTTKAEQDAAFESWRKALALPTVQGLVIGRSLLYPPDDDVAAALDAAVGLLREGSS